MYAVFACVSCLWWFSVILNRVSMQLKIKLFFFITNKVSCLVFVRVDIFDSVKFFQRDSKRWLKMTNLCFCPIRRDTNKQFITICCGLVLIVSFKLYLFLFTKKNTYNQLLCWYLCILHAIQLFVFFIFIWFIFIKRLQTRIESAYLSNYN